MKFYSEILNKVFDTEKACLEAELTHKRALEAKAREEEQKKIAEKKKQEEELQQQLQQQMQDVVLSVATRILAGEAEKTPSAEACGFCPVRADCNRAYHR